jgi:hypothetical protein
MGREKQIIKELKNNDYKSFDEFYSLVGFSFIKNVLAGLDPGHH